MIPEFDGPYAWLSNFTPCPITYDGYDFASVEHAYMSAKSDDPAWKLFCADAANSPGKVKRKSRKIVLREDWEERKVAVMREVLQLKFAQQPFRDALLNTGNRYLQEGNTWGDLFWGVDLQTGEGKNQLGVLLMDIRDRLKEEETPPNWLRRRMRGLVFRK